MTQLYSRREVTALGAFGALSLLALGGCTSTDTNRDAVTSTGATTLRVGQVQLPIFAPLYVADAAGYFAEAGITIELQNFTSGQDAIPLLAKDSLDVLVAGFSAGMFNALHAGLGVSVVGSMGISDGTENSPTALVARPDITTVAALRGTTIAVAGGVGGTAAYLLDIALTSDAVSLADVTLMNLANPDIPAALANGSIDAALVSAPFSTGAVAAGSGRVLAVPPAGTSGTGVLYGDEFRRSPTAQMFFSALARGARDLQGDDRYSARNTEIIAAATGQTTDQLAAVPLYNWLPTLAPLPDQLAAMERTWMATGALNYTDPLPAADYIDDSFSAAAAG